MTALECTANISSFTNFALLTNPILLFHAHSEEALNANEGHEIVAMARGVFDHNGGCLSSVETGVSIVIPTGAIPEGIKQEVYFKVCKDTNNLPPLDKDKGRRVHFVTPIPSILCLIPRTTVTSWARQWKYAAKRIICTSIPEFFLNA